MDFLKIFKYLKWVNLALIVGAIFEDGNMTEAEENVLIANTVPIVRQYIKSDSRMICFLVKFAKAFIHEDAKK